MGFFKALSRVFNQGRGFVLLERSAHEFRRSRLHAARGFAEEAVRVFRRIGYRWGEEAALGNLGMTYYETGDLPGAISCYEESLKIIEEIDDRHGRVRTLGYLGSAYAELGQYVKAIECHERSLQLTAEIDDGMGRGYALGNLGLIYSLLGEYEKALEYAGDSLQVLRAIGNDLGQVRALISQGVIYHELDNVEKAIESYTQALAIATRINDDIGAGRAMTNLGTIYLSESDMEKATEYFEKSLVVKRATSDRKGEVSALSNLGLIQLSMGEVQKAVAQSSEALTLARAIGDPRLTAMSLTQLGVALLSAGEPQQSEAHLFEAVSLWETTRAGLGTNDNSKVSIFERQEITYRALQRTLVKQQKYGAALEVAERGRARTLVELLGRKLLPVGGGAEPVAGISLARMREVAAAERATLVEYSIVYRDIEGLKGKEGRASDIYIWVVPPTGEVEFRSVKLELPRGQTPLDLSTLVSDTRAAIGVSERDVEIPGVGPATDGLEDARLLNYIHQLLIKPVEKLLPTDPNTRVIFIPHRELAGIPFPALTDDAGTYLIKCHTILTAPSIQFLEYAALAARKHLPGDAPHGALVVGNPSMPTISAPGKVSKPLRPLPFAEQEAVTIAELLKTDALIGAEATKVNVVERMSGKRIIHLATHGLLNLAGSGMPGAIALAPTADDDGLLTSEEISDLSLDAELVVLSACNTGQGRMTADGVIGLSRAFVTAGAPSLVVSLWEVADDSTAFLMTEFYQFLKENSDKAAALRHAMIKTLKRYPVPQRWAAFTLIGRAE